MVPGLSPAASYEQRWVPCSNETANLLSAGEVGGSDSEVLKNAFPLPPSRSPVIRECWWKKTYIEKKCIKITSTSKC